MIDTDVETGCFFPPHMRVVLGNGAVRIVHPVTFAELEADFPGAFDRSPANHRVAAMETVRKSLRRPTLLETMKEKYP